MAKVIMHETRFSYLIARKMRREGYSPAEIKAFLSGAEAILDHFTTEDKELFEQCKEHFQKFHKNNVIDMEKVSVRKRNHNVLMGE